MKLNGAEHLEKAGGGGTVTSDLNLEFFIDKMRLILCIISTYPEHGRFRMYNNYAIVLNIKSRVFLFYSFQHTLVNLSVFINVFLYIHFIKKIVQFNIKHYTNMLAEIIRPGRYTLRLCIVLQPCYVTCAWTCICQKVVCIKFHYIVHFSSKPTHDYPPPPPTNPYIHCYGNICLN